MTPTVADLKRALQPVEPVSHQGLDLTSIRRAGARRRHLRSASLGAGAAAAAAAAFLALGSPWGLGGGAGPELAADPEPAAPTTAAPTTAAPTGLSALAERALAEIPGAQRVSDTTVVLPAPDLPSVLSGARLADEQRLRVETEMSAHSYSGVTAWDAGVWPAWLYDGVLAAEKAQDDGDGYPVGSSAEGIVVDQGPLWLSCVWFPEAGMQRSDCAPRFFHRTAGKAYDDWGFGSDRFLQPGAPMEVFLTKNWSTGEPTTFAVAGIHGTKVDRAVFITTDGREVAGQVQVDLVAEGDSLFYADVPGELERVIAYGADGAVIEDHELLPCDSDSPADCEVR